MWVCVCMCSFVSGCRSFGRVCLPVSMCVECVWMCLSVCECVDVSVCECVDVSVCVIL